MLTNAGYAACPPGTVSRNWLSVAGVQRCEVVDDHVYTTADPEVVIFEFRYAGVVDSRTFSMPCIFVVVRVRDGEIEDLK